MKSKKLGFLGGDTFELTVYDESYRDLVVALTIAVDDILDDEAKSRH